MALRATVTGTISFGLVTIPVKFYLAASNEQLKFNQISPKGNRVKQKLVDAVDGDEVAAEDTRKGYEFEKGKFVTFSKDEFARLEMNATQTITVKEFISADQLDDVAIEKSQYLGPDRGGDKGYRLLSEAMKSQGKIAIAQWSTKGREHLCCIRPYFGGLLLQQLFYAHEVRPFAEIVVAPVPLVEAEKLMAVRLIEAMSNDEYDPCVYVDTYGEEVKKAVEAKVAGQEITIPKDVKQAANIHDFMDAMKLSIEAAKKTKAAKKPAKKVKK